MSKETNETKKTKTRTYKSDIDYITQNITYGYFGECQMYGTFNTGDGYGFSAMAFKNGRGTKGLIIKQIVDMVLYSGRPIRGYYD